MSLGVVGLRWPSQAVVGCCVLAGKLDTHHDRASLCVDNVVGCH